MRNTLALVVLLGALLPCAEAADDGGWFYAGLGQEMSRMVDGHVGGLAVRLTGAVVARTTDPGALRDWGEVRSVRPLSRDGQIVRIELDAGVDELSWSVSLRERPDVVWAHPDFAIQTRGMALTDDPYVEDQWHLRNLGQRGWTANVDIGIERAWELTEGDGQLIAILDGGVDGAHPDLEVIGGYDYVDMDPDSNPNPELESAAHGTSCAGLAAARANNGVGIAGVAPNADVYAIRMLGGYVDSSGIYEAFVEAVDAGATVLSNSWGYAECDPAPLVAIMDEGLDYVEKKGRGGLGSAFVMSAGNSNCDFSGDEIHTHRAVVSVGAVSGHDERESYSNYGPLLDIVAPSGGILTTDIVGPDGYGSWEGDEDYWGGYNGTSASAPIVAGAMALMFAANERLDVKDARKVLCSTATKIDPIDGEWDEEGHSVWFGCGRLNAGAAVQAVWNSAPLAPEALGPDGEVEESMVVLRWEDSVDPDGDVHTYEVEIVPAADPSGAWTELVTGNELDVRDSVAVGGSYSWSVWGHDPWGASPASESHAFTVVEARTARVTEEPEEEPVTQGCSQGGSAGWTAGWPALLTSLGARRRARPR
jgi:subtilisin family serine protease